MSEKYQILIGLLILGLAIFIGMSRGEPENVCRCLELVGDENNFVCYTSLGELDTEGECVGPKAYK
ncbi:MAG: hypothetical protein A2629_00040 [Candidatus Levybacteria bacterium RIFCSPHIGHO2_01_FULL_41_15]|nr:MAG: hypothetical protein A2629_00040 [Candidatus Levybacteria bacterium RIFCSPHIGHO2_01_FULL_41_15]